MCEVNDTVAKEVESIWKESFQDASLLPVVGIPSTSNGVIVLTHTLNNGMKMKINGLESSSPLANNALFSSECVNGTYLNFYEILLPDIPGKNGEPSTCQVYIKSLGEDPYLSVAGVHFHWLGESIYPDNADHGITAIHHQNEGLDPISFSKRTIQCLEEYIEVLNERVNSNGRMSLKPKNEMKSNEMNDVRAKKIVKIWKESFNDSILLPVIGLPSNANGVMTLTNTLGPMKMIINGLESSSPLANNTLYSAEYVDGIPLNLFEVMIPDIPGKKGEPSTAAIYLRELNKRGLDVTSVHYHWDGGWMFENDRGMIAIHHTSTQFSPEEFSKRTIKALQTVNSLIKKKSKM